MKVIFKEKRTVDGPVDIGAVVVSPLGTTFGFSRDGVLYRTTSGGPFPWVEATAFDLPMVPELVERILKGYEELEESEATDDD